MSQLEHAKAVTAVAGNRRLAMPLVLCRPTCVSHSHVQWLSICMYKYWILYLIPTIPPPLIVGVDIKDMHERDTFAVNSSSRHRSSVSVGSFVGFETHTVFLYYFGNVLQYKHMGTEVVICMPSLCVVCNILGVYCCQPATSSSCSCYSLFVFLQCHAAAHVHERVRRPMAGLDVSIIAVRPQNHFSCVQHCLWSHKQCHGIRVLNVQGMLLPIPCETCMLSVCNCNH